MVAVLFDGCAVQLCRRAGSPTWETTSESLERVGGVSLKICKIKMALSQIGPDNEEAVSDRKNSVRHLATRIKG